MNGGVKSLLVAASFAAASCAAAPDGVEIRPIADPGSKLRRGADGLADARGQLAIGNVALALEAFRKVARDYPDNAEAYAGMAACYESMGRFDIAETKYEAALAVAPRNPALLTALAGVLDRLGRADDAAGVRSEIAQINSAAAALDRTAAADEPEPAQTVRVALAPVSTVTVALPPPQPAAPAAVAAARPKKPPVSPTRPAVPAAQVTVALPAPRLAERASVSLDPAPLAVRSASLDEKARLNADLSSDIPAPRLAERAGLSLNSVPLAVRSVSLADPTRLNVDLSPDIPAPQLAGRAAVTLRALPLPMRGANLDQHARMNVDLSSAIPARRLGQPSAVNPRSDGAPRLERMSPGEVALLTGSGPAWGGQVVARTPQKLSVRWVPLATAAARPNIRLLNAARWQGLAARNRSYLLDRGWRRIAIGDAPQTRQRSVVLYPAAHAAIGRRLAAQFGCRAQPVKGADEFLVLLGRDAALRPARSRG